MPRRRQILQLAGSASALLLPQWLAPRGVAAQAAAPARCVNNIEATAGPYPSINPLHRADLRASTAGAAAQRPGERLDLRIRILDIERGCAPIPNAVVDIWSADGKGVYSGYSDFGTGQEDFCRGYQISTADGVAGFTTVFPGCYPGRAVHVHMAVQSQARNLRPRSHGRDIADVYVTQLYFQNEVVEELFGRNPAYREGGRFVPNESDYHYREEGGRHCVVDVERARNAYRGEIGIALKRAAIGMQAPTRGR